MLTQILIGIFVVSFLIQLTYWLLVYPGVFFTDKIPVNNENLPPLSVIISARNEAENLKKFLPLILTQDYPNFELIVIDDNSSDKTLKVLSEYKKKYQNLIVLEAEKNVSGKGNKKRALTKAISKSKNDLFVFTDADCYPVSNLWLKNISSTYQPGTEIVIGFGAYEKYKGFLNRIIRFETLFNALQYLSFADLGFPYMAVGRNLSYKKTAFLNSNGFNSHKNILSGDDDLFINEAANKKNTKIAAYYESKTISIPKKSFKSYLLQKRRHFSAGYKYQVKNKIIIGVEIMTRFMFYLVLLILLIEGNVPEFVITLFLFRIIVSVSIIKLFAVKMKESNNLFFIPIFDILIPILNLFILSRIFFEKKIVWK